MEASGCVCFSWECIWVYFISPFHLTVFLLYYVQEEKLKSVIFTQILQLESLRAQK